LRLFCELDLISFEHAVVKPNILSFIGFISYIGLVDDIEKNKPISFLIIYGLMYLVLNAGNVMIAFNIQHDLPVKRVKGIGLTSLIIFTFYLAFDIVRTESYSESIEWGFLLFYIGLMLPTYINMFKLISSSEPNIDIDDESILDSEL
jgi:hypothetical protein